MEACYLDNFLEDDFEKVVLCGPLIEESAFFLMLLKNKYGLKFDTWGDSIPAAIVGAQMLQNSISSFSLDSKPIFIKNEIIIPKLAIRINNSEQTQTIINNNTPLPLEITLEIDLTAYNNGMIDRPPTIHLLELFGEEIYCISSTPLDFVPTSLTLTIKIDSKMNTSLVFQDKHKDTEKKVSGL